MAHEIHTVLNTPIRPPFPAGKRLAMFGMGCFWGIEKLFWQLPGVYTTAVGYSGGHIVNPTYEQVCTGTTNHAEVVSVVYDPAVISYRTLLKTFWENHDCTTPNRQGNDIGTQYRSCIFSYDEEQDREAQASLRAFQIVLSAAGLGEITTQVAQAGEFYYGEGYHQQYLAKKPWGYCGVQPMGVKLPDNF